MFRSFVPDVRRRHVALNPSRPGASMADLAGILDEFWKAPLEGLPFSKEGEGQIGVMPAMNLRETPEAYEVTAELPGVQAGDVEVTMEKGVLRIKGEKKSEEEKEGDNWHHVERRYGSFSRSVTLPAPVKEDAVTASFSNGVLTLTLPKAEEEKARKIEIAG